VLPLGVRLYYGDSRKTAALLSAEEKRPAKQESSRG
jgi:hypothetical protein